MRAVRAVALGPAAVRWSLARGARQLGSLVPCLPVPAERGCPATLGASSLCRPNRRLGAARQVVSVSCRARAHATLSATMAAAAAALCRGPVRKPKPSVYLSRSTFGATDADRAPGRAGSHVCCSTNVVPVPRREISLAGRFMRRSRSPRGTGTGTGTVPEASF